MEVAHHRRHPLQLQLCQMLTYEILRQLPES
jgi:hypothetical protein